MVSQPRLDTPKSIWGKLIALTREEKNIPLHITCGNTVDVDIIGKTFIVRTTENYIYEKLGESKLEIKEYFKKLGYDFDVEVEKIITIDEKVNEDLEKLRKIAESYLKIKE